MLDGYNRGKAKKCEEGIKEMADLNAQMERYKQARIKKNNSKNIKETKSALALMLEFNF